MELVHYQQELQKAAQDKTKLSDQLIPATQEQALKALEICPLQYYKAIYPKTFDEIFISPAPSIAKCKKELGETKTRAAIILMIADAALQFNTGQNMNIDQVGELATDIMEIYYWLKIDDLKMCFKNAMRGRYGETYRIDGSIIMTWIDKYCNDRLNAADETSYREHQSSKSDKNLVSFLDEKQVYEHFKKKND